MPVANQAFPAATLWEFRAAKKQAVDEGRKHIDEALIARMILERRQIVDTASATTKKARRDAQKNKVHSKNSTPARPVKVPVEAPPSIPASDGLLLDDVDLIGDIQ